MAQKPPAGTFANNWREHRVGLLDFGQKVGTGGVMVPANVMCTDRDLAAASAAFLVPKARRAYKVGPTRETSSHIPVKPVELMEHLIRLVTPGGGTVLDPFNGSGSTGIAALAAGSAYVGFELSPLFFEETKRRFTGEFHDEGITFADCILAGVRATASGPLPSAVLGPAPGPGPEAALAA